MHDVQREIKHKRTGNAVEFIFFYYSFPFRLTILFTSEYIFFKKMTRGINRLEKDRTWCVLFIIRRKLNQL